MCSCRSLPLNEAFIPLSRLICEGEDSQTRQVTDGIDAYPASGDTYSFRGDHRPRGGFEKRSRAVPPYRRAGGRVLRGDGRHVGRLGNRRGFRVGLDVDGAHVVITSAGGEALRRNFLDSSELALR